MALADGKLDTMPLGTAASVLGVDSNGRPVLARQIRMETVNANEGVELGVVPNNGFGVAYYRPTKTTNVGAFDVMPNGTPSSIAGYGYSWMDVCSIDISAGPLNVQCAHLAIRSDFAEVSMRAFTLAGDNSGTKLPLVFGVGNDSDVTECFRSNTDGTFQFGAANIIANASVATAMSSVGPTGSRTTIQKWFIIKDASGNPFYVPAW